MPTLLLATSGPYAEVGLLDPVQGLASAPLEARHSRGRDLLPAIAALLEAYGLSPSALHAIVADVGPGSFTGVRVGVTTAKTLAFSLGCPVLGILSLDVLAAAAEDANPAPGPLVAVRDAGRRRAYAARYEAGRCVSAPARLDPPDLAALCQGATVVGEDLAPQLRDWGLDAPALDVRTTAAALWRVADPRLRQGEHTPAHDLAPRYLQASAPERLRDGERPGDA